MKKQNNKSLFKPLLFLSAALLGVSILVSGCAPSMRSFAPDLKNTLFLPRFGFFIINYPSVDSDSSRGDLYARLRYDDVAFVHTDSGFSAHYQFSVNIFSNKDLSDLKYTKIFNRQLSVPTYAETNSTTMYDTLEDKMTLPPGNYYVVLKLYDFNTTHTSTREFEHSFKDFHQDPVNVSDVLLYRHSHQTGVPVSRVKSGVDSLIAKFFVTAKTIPANISMHVNARSAQVPTAMDTTFELTQINNVQLYRLPIEISGLAPGTYAFEVSVKENGKTNSSQATFEILRGKVPLLPAELDQAIAPLAYIANSNELDSLKEGSFEERQKSFLDFWLARTDGNKEAAEAMRDEFYRRVDFANEHFAGGPQKGWQSDRGRIYILYGPPDEVDDHSNNFNSPPYQIWYYYSLRLEFVFLDEFGTGNYQLVQSSQLQ
ncbi:MAG: GWxTD domain-containing protein [Bacteroidetes bacterium]|nr:GWxTD domain-containing protein [Bacteroidota bacterium]MCL5267598.1 GWxTD domain-containing protein [Bacteroidota bacterium]